jgi:subfamily B ATP-binding cassette protein HlyB/CyaB
MCHLQRIPFAPNLVLQQVAPPYGLNALQLAAETLGLKAGVKQATATELAKLPLPCLAVLKPASARHPVAAANESITPSPLTGEGGGEGAGEGQDVSPPYRLALVLKANDARVLLFDENSKNPFESALTDFEVQYSGQVILFQSTSKAAVEGDPMLARKKEFGFNWFIPELLKHKQIWRDVLLASLAIQLMALATPVFTQVVIDKVIVHHTTSTLIVIAIGLLIFMLFSTAMTWIRQHPFQQYGMLDGVVRYVSADASDKAGENGNLAQANETNKPQPGQSMLSYRTLVALISASGRLGNARHTSAALRW